MTPRALDLDQLERVEYARLVRKGGGTVGTTTRVDASAGPVIGGFVRSALTGSTPCTGGIVGADVALGALLVAPRIGACVESFAHDVLAATTTELHASVGVDYVFDLPLGLAVGLGPDVGVAWLQQSFVAEVARTSDNRLGGPLVGAHGSVAWNLPLGFTPTATLFARTYVLPVERSVAVIEVAALFVTGGAVTLTRYF